MANKAKHWTRFKMTRRNFGISSVKKFSKFLKLLFFYQHLDASKAGLRLINRLNKKWGNCMNLFYKKKSIMDLKMLLAIYRIIFHQMDTSLWLRFLLTILLDCWRNHKLIFRNASTNYKMHSLNLSRSVLHTLFQPPPLNLKYWKKPYKPFKHEWMRLRFKMFYRQIAH